MITTDAYGQTYELLRKITSGAHAGYAVFRQTLKSGHKRIVVYEEQHDIQGRPHWEETMDHGDVASVLAQLLGDTDDNSGGSEP